MRNGGRGTRLWVRISNDWSMGGPSNFMRGNSRHGYGFVEGIENLDRVAFAAVGLRYGGPRA